MLLENLDKRCTILTTLILTFYMGLFNCQNFPGIVKISGKLLIQMEIKFQL